MVYIDRWDVLQRLIKHGAFTFSVKDDQTLISALNRKQQYDVIQYLVNSLPYFHLEELMRITRINGRELFNITDSAEKTELTDLLIHIEIN